MSTTHPSTHENMPHIVVIGGGFGGLFTIQNLEQVNARITLIDRRNFHLFQPLLYQVATGGLSPGDIASPLRTILKKQKNTRVIQGKVVDIQTDSSRVVLEDGKRIDYDYLVVATGVRHHYFGNDQWSERAPGLKTIENALDIRRRILTSFEAAEREQDPEKRKGLQRFVIVGAGPTGVELAGALGELAHATMTGDFRDLNLDETEILLLEGADQVLPSFPSELAKKAQASLEKLGVKVRTETLVTDISEGRVVARHGNTVEIIHSANVLWAAGVKASPMGAILQQHLGVPLDRAGRVIVNSDLSVGKHDNVFVIGDLAHYQQANGNVLPGVAPVAMQQGRYLARLLASRLSGKKAAGPFRYKDKGSLAVIGRNAAVAHVGRFRFSGLPAWLLWAGVHIHYLIEFGNKFIVSFQWFWNYITKKRGARLITRGIEDDSIPSDDRPADRQVS